MLLNIKSPKDNNSEATVTKYLSTLEGKFGRTGSGEDVIVKLRATDQGPGKKLSQYLAQMERFLQSTSYKMGVAWHDLDHLRLEQV